MFFQLYLVGISLVAIVGMLRVFSASSLHSRLVLVSFLLYSDSSFCVYCAVQRIRTNLSEAKYRVQQQRKTHSTTTTHTHAHTHAVIIATPITTGRTTTTKTFLTRWKLRSPAFYICCICYLTCRTIVLFRWQHQKRIVKKKLIYKF